MQSLSPDRELRLIELEDRYTEFFDHALFGIVVSDETGAVLECNKTLATMLGYATPEELCRKQARDLYWNPGDRSIVLEQLAGNGLLANFEVCLRTRDDKPLWALMSLRRAESRDGTPARITTTLIDITERKLLERQFHQARKMEAIGRLAGGIAHDFNNQLTAILGFTELTHDRLERLAQRDRPDPEIAQCLAELAEVTSAATHAAALTKQLLAFSRQEVVQPTVLDLNACIRDTQSMLRHLIGENIELRTLLEPALGRIVADPSQLQQVLMNLVINARDAMEDGGQLTIETANATVDVGHTFFPAAKPGEYVQLTVSDTGCGMDAETKSHIFEPFFTTKDPGKGTGLGLATVYGLVKQWNGDIWVYSELGHGTTFKLSFPRIDVAAPGALAPADLSRLVGIETILLIEDDATVRRLAAQTLRQAGYSVLLAASGADALQLFEQYTLPIHLLLTDLMMPGADGQAVAAQLISRRPALKVLFTSGYTAQSPALNRVLLARSPFLQKPFGVQQLLTKVRDVLDGVERLLHT